MRIAIAAVCLLVLSCLAPSSRAQDGPPPVETVTVYYENEVPDSLGMMLLQWNVCFERFVTLNPGLEIDNIPYGTRVLLPKDEPCYDYSAGTNFMSLDEGKPLRLKYYEEGAWLAAPYYSNDAIYQNYRDIDSLVRRLAVCRDDLLAENYGMQRYGDRYLQLQWASADIFILRDKVPCKDTASPRTITLHRRVSEFSPQDLLQEYNICAEEMPLSWGGIHDSSRNYRTEFWIPQPGQPCYNEAGQRLIYFDIDGKPLDEPEYTDLQVYRVRPGETREEIAQKHGVCLIDFIRLNYFPELPIANGEIELFIPEVRPCPENVRLYEPPADEYVFSDLTEAAAALDICYEALAALNPHLYPSSYFTIDRKTQPGPYRRIRNALLLLPAEAEPCYRTYKAHRGESIYHIERELNICHEAFLRTPSFDQGRLIGTDETVLYIRRDTPPCYDEMGRRLRYTPLFNVYNGSTLQRVAYQPMLKQPADYAEMDVHIFERADTVYSVSRQYNVCVRELLAVNPVLKSSLPEGFPTFIPDTRPCYDEATGMPLIYEDADGVPLDEPRVGDKLIYYGTEPFGHVSHYYNVCENRIRDANAAKLAGEAHYLGWIIPHDRPPCYDEDGYPIDYAVKQHQDSGGMIHTVQMGDTLSGIATRYDKSIYWIADANNLSSVNMIWVEQRLIIPGGVTTRDVRLISAALIGLAAAGAVVMWRRR